MKGSPLQCWVRALRAAPSSSRQLSEQVGSDCRAVARRAAPWPGNMDIIMTATQGRALRHVGRGQRITYSVSGRRGKSGFDWVIDGGWGCPKTDSYPVRGSGGKSVLCEPGLGVIGRGGGGHQALMCRLEINCPGQHSRVKYLILSLNTGGRPGGGYYHSRQGTRGWGVGNGVKHPSPITSRSPRL